MGRRPTVSPAKMECVYGGTQDVEECLKSNFPMAQYGFFLYSWIQSGIKLVD